MVPYVYYSIEKESETSTDGSDASCFLPTSEVISQPIILIHKY